MYWNYFSVKNFLLKAKFSLESTFENWPHVKSAFTELQSTCSKEPIKINIVRGPQRPQGPFEQKVDWSARKWPLT